MSAFAARKANQTPTTRIAPQTTDIEQPVIEAQEELQASRFPRKKRRHGERPKSVGIQQSTLEKGKPSITIEEHEIRTPNELDAGGFESEGESYRYGVMMKAYCRMSDIFAAQVLKALKILRLPFADFRTLCLLRATLSARPKQNGRSNCIQTTYAAETPTRIHKI